ncbi:citrate lyase beta subunit [Gymnopilus junonius]|uniref:Citrate lyase beta subunit n=1 Tax=Gymnopilus junonius TaxID=109634 RepID=A0A9P5NUF1_GYMJU|nr:citrate lyase beta subunit [Gymnopilus junonius]
MLSSIRLSYTRTTKIRSQLPVNGTRYWSSEVTLRRSYLYVPSSSDRMLEKSLTAGSDVVIYDLEDSVPPNPEDKRSARERLRKFLEVKREDLKPLQVAVRVNDVTTPFFYEDMLQIISQPAVRSIVLPKIHSTTDLDLVSDAVKISRKRLDKPTLQVIPSIESARGMWNLGSIANWESPHGPVSGGVLKALLFAAEDYCADTGIIRTPSRRELLYTRSQIVLAAKAFGLGAVDMVCVDFKDTDILHSECMDGRELGFTGKQAIHPSQVSVINKTYVPTKEEIQRAVKIVQSMKVAHKSNQGAIELDGRMIDAPMMKQAESILRVAEAAGLAISGPALKW